MADVPVAGAAAAAMAQLWVTLAVTVASSVPIRPDARLVTTRCSPVKVPTSEPSSSMNQPAAVPAANVPDATMTSRTVASAFEVTPRMVAPGAIVAVPPEVNGMAQSRKAVVVSRPSDWVTVTQVGTNPHSTLIEEPVPMTAPILIEGFIANLPSLFRWTYWSRVVPAPYRFRAP